MKIMTILGTRPEIIRLSLIIRKLDLYANQHVLVHTGQNYDKRLSDIFFEQLGVRNPDYHIRLSAQHFGKQVGRMFSIVEKIIERERPDRILLLGDTNSALCAILAARMGIPVYHMEAGNRCFDHHVPEEINRRIIDSISTFNLPYTELSRDNLLREGIPSQRIWISGNPIYEVLQEYRTEIEGSDILNQLNLKPRQFFLVTAHRAENVDDAERLRNIMQALHVIADEWGFPVICSVHPRTASRLEQFEIAVTNPNVRLSAPFGLFDFVYLQNNACCVITDSGTVQEESCILGTPAVTIRNSTERPETVLCGSNVVSGLDFERIVQCTRIMTANNHAWICPKGYTDGNVSNKIVNFVLGGLHYV